MHHSSLAYRGLKISTLRAHDKMLRGKQITLRPLTEEDWDLLLQWNSDAEVLYFSEGDDVESYSLEDVQGMYRSVSRSAFCFIIESESGPIGECWLQEMNLERILQRYPGHRCHRIDLMIGEKEHWGRGLGSEVVKLLVQFAFAEQESDFVFGCDVADYNRGSQRVFEKNGFTVDSQQSEPPGSKAAYRYDFVLSRNIWAE